MWKDIKNLEWVEIVLWYNCNYNCYFCFEWKIKNKWDEIKKTKIINTIKQWFLNGKKFIIFSWWEPTIYKDLLYYISFSKKIWYKKIILHTNWTWISDMNYLINLYNNWLTWVIISIHWYWKISNLITWNANSFDFLNKSLINSSIIKNKDFNFSIDTNTVINKLNIKNLLILMKYLVKFPITRRMITLPYSLFSFDNSIKLKIFPKMNVIINELNEVLDFVFLNNIKDVVVEAIPFCFFDSKYWQFIEKNYRTKKNVYLPDSFFIKNMSSNDHYSLWKIKLKTCFNCSKNSNCIGLSEDYFNLYKNSTILNPIYF